MVETFGNDVNIVDKYDNGAAGDKDHQHYSTWCEIIASKDMYIELIQLGIAVILNIDNYSNIEIDNTVISSDGCKYDITPLFWAVNNRLYSILQLMLQNKHNIIKINTNNTYQCIKYLIH